jgi:hypothetical protein
MRDPSAEAPSRVTGGSHPTAFSAIELLIVCAVVGVFAMLAYPRVNFTQFRVDSGARTVQMTLHNAERLAATRKYDVVVSFDEPGGRMRILEDRNGNGAIDEGERVTFVSLEDGTHFETPAPGLGGPVSGSIVGSNVKTIDGMPSVIFHRDGSVSTSLEVYIESKRDVPADARAIKLVQGNGRTDWYRYADGVWKMGSI